MKISRREGEGMMAVRRMRREGELEDRGPAVFAMLTTYLIPVVGLFLLLAGCGTPPAQGMSTPAVKAVPQLKIAIFDDKSGSTEHTRVQLMTVEVIEPLLGLLDRRGGELAYGIISDRSNKGLVRIVIPEPPVEPVEPDSRQNPFLLAEERAVYEKRMAEYQEAMDRRKTVVVRQLTSFREQVGKMTSLPRNAARTDIWGAVRRLELYMNEPLTSKMPPHRYAIFATDGLDTTGAPKPRFESGTTLVVVNGSASLGAMEELRPLRFESLESSIAYVLAREGG